MNASITVALALASGTAGQACALRLRLPGIVLLLAVGLALGPDGLNVVRPATLGSALFELVSFAVAVILFEGGLSLDLRRLRRESTPIRRLVTVGALVTALGGATVAHLALEWSVRLSLLFGTLIIVTGPTVITPLLRRIKAVPSVSTILAAEGVFIDAIGAIVAVVALEVALSPTLDSLAAGALDVGSCLGFGVLAGAAGGLLLVLLLRARKLIPEGLENIVVLSITIALFHLANLVFHESGIAAVTVAGIVVGNWPTPVERELQEFKEQLTVMFIGMLFVLLAADVRLAEVANLGWRGALVVVAVIAIVRPLSVAFSTLRSGLDLRQRIFLGLIGPRGIVAAAVASLVAARLEQEGLAGGRELRALIFSVIAATVMSAGVAGAPVARLLGLRRKVDAGWVILGANRLAQLLANLLREGSEEVVCVESNPRVCAEAEAAGVRVIHGNGLKMTTLRRAEIEARAGAIGMTPNDEVNLLFAHRAARAGEELRLCVVLADWEHGLTAEMVRDAGAEVAFGAATNVDVWSRRIARAEAVVKWWRVAESDPELTIADTAPHPAHLALALRRGHLVVPVGDMADLRAGDEVALLVRRRHAEKVETRLRERGWTQLQRSASRVQ